MIYTGDEIQRLREAHEWTQQELADMLGVSSTTVSRWETSRSEPSRDHMGRLIELFTNGGQPDRIAVLEELVSQLRDDHAALVTLVLRLARDFEEFRTTATELLASAAERVSDAAPPSESQAEQ